MKKSIIFLLTFFTLSSLILAKEQSNIGLIMRINPSAQIGIIYHFTPAFSLRPYIGFSQSNEKAEDEYKPLRNTTTSKRSREVDSTRIIFGLGFLYYFYSVKDLSIYSVLDFGYIRETINGSETWLDREWDSSGEHVQLDLLLGLQCQLVKHLSVFGEVGFGYSIRRYESDNYLESSRRIKRWGMANSGVGIIFYF